MADLTDIQVAALAADLFETTEDNGCISTDLWDDNVKTFDTIRPDAALLSLAREVQRHRETLATLRAWMAEYPNDKYTGAWWLAELREMRGGGMNLCAISRAIGVSRHAVRDVVDGRTWRHVA
jgi:hypothetical protein